MPIVNHIVDLHDEITAWRRGVHAHPNSLYDARCAATCVAGDRAPMFFVSVM